MCLKRTSLDGSKTESLERSGPRDARPSTTARVACRLIRVLRGTLGSLQFLHVVRCQLRRIERDGHLVDLASEVERHLIVAVIHRCGATETDIEALVERLDQGKGPLQLLGRHYLAVDRQRSGAAAAHTA